MPLRKRKRHLIRWNAPQHIRSELVGHGRIDLRVPCMRQVCIKEPLRHYMQTHYTSTSGRGSEVCARCGQGGTAQCMDCLRPGLFAPALDCPALPSAWTVCALAGCQCFKIHAATRGPSMCARGRQGSPLQSIQAGVLVGRILTGAVGKHALQKGPKCVCVCSRGRQGSALHNIQARVLVASLYPGSDTWLSMLSRPGSWLVASQPVQRMNMCCNTHRISGSSNPLGPHTRAASASGCRVGESVIHNISGSSDALGSLAHASSTALGLPACQLGAHKAMPALSRCTDI